MSGFEFARCETNTAGVTLMREPSASICWSAIICVPLQLRRFGLQTGEREKISGVAEIAKRDRLRWRSLESR